LSTLGIERQSVGVTTKFSSQEETHSHRLSIPQNQRPALAKADKLAAFFRA
jgi:hypothetical protein